MGNGYYQHLSIRENKRDIYDFMRFKQLAQTDSLFQFFDLSVKDNRSLLLSN